MENLFADLLPNVDLEEALASKSRDVGGNTARLRSDVLSYSGATPPSDTIYTTTETPQDSISEAVPDEADGFDWQEDVNELADGMAALSVKPQGTGYLGSTAGVFFLRSLLFWLGYSRSAYEAYEKSVESPETMLRIEPSSHIAQTIESRHVRDQLIDSYFSVYHRTYPFIHEATFRAQYHEVIPRPRRRSWEMLMHTILALGAWCLDDSQSDVDEDLYHRALSFGEDESLFESANLTFVQALILLSNLSQKRNKPNTGSNFLGLAVRMALSLGLHRELPDWEISTLQREMRRRAWWGLYIFDSGASTTFGRPILLPDKEAMDVRPVLNIPDEQLTARTQGLPVESDNPTLYSGMKWQSDLHLHSNYISNRLLSSTGVSPEDASSMDQALNAWTQRLPAYFNLDQELTSADPAFLFARCRIWWRFWNLKIILFRQLLLKRAVERSKQMVSSTSTDQDGQRMYAAVAAARATIVSIQNFTASGLNNRLVAWYSM